MIDEGTNAFRHPSAAEIDHTPGVTRELRLRMGLAEPGYGIDCISLPVKNRCSDARRSASI